MLNTDQKQSLAGRIGCIVQHFLMLCIMVAIFLPSKVERKFGLIVIVIVFSLVDISVWWSKKHPNKKHPKVCKPVKTSKIVLGVFCILALYAIWYMLKYC